MAIELLSIYGYSQYSLPSVSESYETDEITMNKLFYYIFCVTHFLRNEVQYIIN